MPSNFSTIRREIAAVLIGILGLAAHFVPALATVDPIWIDLVSGAGALAVLALVENRIDGIPVVALARIAADHLIRDGNVIEAIRAARTLCGDPPEPDLTGPPRTGRAIPGAPTTRGGG